MQTTLLQYSLVSSFDPIGFRYDPIDFLNLVITPVVAGLPMALMGRWRARRGDSLLRLDRFAYR
jgi:hypothetical protein